MLGTDAVRTSASHSQRQLQFAEWLLCAGAVGTRQIPQRNLFLTYFTIKETSAQRGEIACPRSPRS